MKETVYSIKNVIFLAVALALVSCGGNGSSNNANVPPSAEPETGQAILDSDTTTLSEPVRTPNSYHPETTAGYTVPGTEHFIASYMDGVADPSIKALGGFLHVSLERNASSVLSGQAEEQFSVELSGDAVWLAIPSNCALSGDIRRVSQRQTSLAMADSVTTEDNNNVVTPNDDAGNTLVCSAQNYGSSSNESSSTEHRFSFQPLNAGIVKATIVYPANELPAGVHPATAEVEKFMDPEALTQEIRLEVPELPPLFDNVLTWVSFSLLANLRWEFDTTMDVELSPDIIVENWKVEQLDNDLSDRCSFTGALHCELSDWVGTPNITVSFQVRVPAGTNHNITATVPTLVGEQNGSDNILNLNLISDSTTAVLQALLDAAEDGDTVEFPAGVYVGRLDGNGKKLNIIGAGQTGSEVAGLSAIASSQTSLPTVIKLLEEPVSYSYAGQRVFVGLGAESHVSGIEIQTRGQGVLSGSKPLTLSNSVVKPAPGYSYHTPGFYPPACLLNNRIEGWGADDISNCRALFGVRNSGPNVVQGNLFLNNNCRYGIIYSAQVEDTRPGNFFAVTGTSQPNENLQSTKISVSNNTFINNPFIFGLYGDRGTRTMDFRNNVIFGSYKTSSGFTGNPGAHELTSSSNLVWNSSFESLLNPDHVTVHAPDLNMDPKFQDPDNGDYSLRPESPAIDSGTALADFDPAHPFASSNETCQHNAIDGNFDGIAEPDIGALEHDTTE